MSDYHVNGAAIPYPPQPCAPHELAHPTPHLSLRELIGTLAVTDRPAKTGDAQATLVRNSTVHIDTPEDSRRCFGMVFRRQIGRDTWPLNPRIVIATDVVQRR